MIDKLESLSTKIASLRSELFTLFLRKKNIELHTAIQQIEDLVGDVSKDNELKFTKFFRNSLHFKTKIIDKLSNLKAEVDAA